MLVYRMLLSCSNAAFFKISFPVGICCRCMVAICAQGLWMCRGYPWSLSVWLKSPDLGSTKWTEFKQDRGNFKTLAEHGDRCVAADALLRRSLFMKASVQQLCAAADDARGDDSPAWKADMLAMLTRHAQVALPTQVVEDIIGCMKGTKVKKKGNKFGRPQKGMYMSINKQVVDVRHHFSVPDSSMPVGGRTAELDKSSFQPTKENNSMQWGEVVSTKTVPPYYSPKGENYAHSIADLKLLDHAIKVLLFCFAKQRAFYKSSLHGGPLFSIALC